MRSKGWGSQRTCRLRPNTCDRVMLPPAGSLVAEPGRSSRRTANVLRTSSHSRGPGTGVSRVAAAQRSAPS